jgi:hypothetical protein
LEKLKNQDDMLELKSNSRLGKYFILFMITFGSCSDVQQINTIDENNLEDTITVQNFNNDRIDFSPYDLIFELDNNVLVTNETVKKIQEWISKELPKGIINKLEEKSLLIEIILHTRDNFLNEEIADFRMKQLEEYEGILNMILGDINGFPVALIFPQVLSIEKRDSEEKSYIELKINELKF